MNGLVEKSTATSYLYRRHFRKFIIWSFGFEWDVHVLTPQNEILEGVLWTFDSFDNAVNALPVIYGSLNE